MLLYLQLLLLLCLPGVEIAPVLAAVVPGWGHRGWGLVPDRPLLRQRPPAAVSLIEVWAGIGTIIPNVIAIFLVLERLLSLRLPWGHSVRGVGGGVKRAPLLVVEVGDSRQDDVIAFSSRGEGRGDGGGSVAVTARFARTAWCHGRVPFFKGKDKTQANKQTIKQTNNKQLRKQTNNKANKLTIKQINEWAIMQTNERTIKQTNENKQ